MTDQEKEIRRQIRDRWRMMRHRVKDPNKPYLRRGIKVCDEWQDPDNFSDWSISSGFDSSLTLDRIDNDGDYEPSNCRWITHAQQQQNTSRSRMIEAWGEKKCLAAWSRDPRARVTKWAIAARIDRGWEPEQAISIEPMQRPLAA